MNRRAFYLLFIFLPFLPFNPTEEDWIRTHYTKTEQYITMRDGIKLFTSIYIPKNRSQKHPILLTRTPYSCAPYGENAFTEGQWPLYWRRYCRENYIIVRQDVRGKWMSEGEFRDVRPFIRDKKSNTDIDESSDTYDTIDWLVKNIPLNNGKVGVLGVSYPGFYAAMSASSGHPALKAVSPQAPVTDWYMGDDFHHNGAFFLMDAFAFFSGFGKPRPGPTTLGEHGFDIPGDDIYQFYLKTGTLKKVKELMGDSIVFWNEMYAHPDYDDWWKARDSRRAMYGLRPAVLVVGGLYDAEDCFGALNLYKAIEVQNPGIHNNLVMGPWSHGQWSEPDGSYLGNIHFGSNTSAWYQENIELPFFNYYLKGKGKEPGLPEATIFFSGENQWRNFPSWPPLSIQARPLYFESEQTLSWNKPVYTSNYSSYNSDPANPVPWMHPTPAAQEKEYMIADQSFATGRADVLTFQTATLTEDLVLAGPVVADLKVSISTTDADFVVKIIDVIPGMSKKEFKGGDNNGNYGMLVRGEIMRGRYRNSFEHPQPFTPGEVETVKFTLPDIAHTFKKGHRLMIQVQSSWFPLADRNPQQFVNIYEASPGDFQPSRIRLYHDAQNSSQIILPVLR